MMIRNDLGSIIQKKDGIAIVPNNKNLTLAGDELLAIFALWSSYVREKSTMSQVKVE